MSIRTDINPVMRAPPSFIPSNLNWGFSDGSDSKEFASNAEDLGSIPGSGRSLEENGNTLQHSCLENPMDRGTWWATVHGDAGSQTGLSD